MNAKAETNPGGLGMALDFAPLLIFFLVYKFSDPGGSPLTAILAGTVAFMIAIAIAMLIARIKLGKVSPMMWLSTALVLGFGGLTLYFRDPRFIQIKPTIIYTLFAVALFGGLLTGKPLLKFLLQSAYDGLDEEGWMKLTRNWAVFFAGMAVLNELMRAALDFDLWLTLKVWGVTVLSMIFAFANIPMMMRHGLTLDPKQAIEEKPSEG
jgi:intracellular septation protein